VSENLREDILTHTVDFVRFAVTTGIGAYWLRVMLCRCSWHT